MSKSCDPNLAGQLRHRVTLQSKTEARNDYGEPEHTWSDEATLYAKVDPLSADERTDAQQVGSQRTHKVTIRYRPGVTSEKRLRFDGRTLNITSVINPLEYDRWLELECEEVF